MAPKILGDSLYQLVEGSTWLNAELKSVSLGGHLVAITSAAENSWIKNNIDWNPPKNVTFGAYGYDNSIAYWIGLSDNVFEGTYKWTSGEEFSYHAKNWDKFPTASEDYLTLANNGEWNDLSEIDPHWQMEYGIAEIPITSSIIFSDAPQEGSELITTINVSAGSKSSGNLAEGATVYWNILGVDKSDLSSGSLKGSGVISDGKLSVSHSFAKDNSVDNDILIFSAYSDKGLKHKVGKTKIISIKDASDDASDDTKIPIDEDIHIIGNLKRDKIKGGNLSDIIEGRQGADRIWGQSGDDNIFGQEGNDVIIGGQGDDNLWGGKGKDVFKVSKKSNGKDAIFDFKKGKDKIWVGSLKKIHIKSTNGSLTVLSKGQELFELENFKGNLKKKGKFLL